MEYPEVLLTQVGLIILIAEFLDWRLFEKLNPARKTKTRQGGQIDRPGGGGGRRGAGGVGDEAEKQTQTL